ncbi:hypothetical protein ONS95_015044 [Cadophora gregata]|uniref:uncharacterized protein n=1 Tax=Cadophora gregata TaxID=51156 RepID=UPI0026DC2903|nr:uncharacterized protein ONS95_015044 [Cadophora gregata]KAK0126174.1 hypothetical protein ONS95_015044 [Cadophora gregata]
MCNHTYTYIHTYGHVFPHTHQRKEAFKRADHFRGVRFRVFSPSLIGVPSSLAALFHPAVQTEDQLCKHPAQIRDAQSRSEGQQMQSSCYSSGRERSPSTVQCSINQQATAPEHQSTPWPWLESPRYAKCSATSTGLLRTG